MVELELDGGLTLHIPLKPRMSATEFLEVAERVEHLRVKRESHEDIFNWTPPAVPPSVPAQIMPQPVAPLFQPAPSYAPSVDDFKLPNEDLVRVQHISNQVKSHMDHIKRHEEVIGRHERHLSEILEYLQSLDKYIRR